MRRTLLVLLMIIGLVVFIASTGSVPGFGS